MRLGLVGGAGSPEAGQVMSIWSKMPSRWVRQGGLKQFRAKSAGTNAAALKLYMTVAMFANFKASPDIVVPGFARLSFSNLEDLCNISRQYVGCGLKVLASHELVDIHKTGNANGYFLTGYDDIGWAKLPRSYLLEKTSRFAGLPIRGVLHLEALKLYLALVTFRDNNAQTVWLSYDKIEEYTGIPRRRIRRSIDVLINHEWISLAAHSDGIGDRKATNVYILRGDFWGKQRRTYARASTFSPGLGREAGDPIDLD